MGGGGQACPGGVGRAEESRVQASGRPGEVVQKEAPGEARSNSFFVRY